MSLHYTKVKPAEMRMEQLVSFTLGVMKALNIFLKQGTNRSDGKSSAVKHKNTG